MFNAMMAMLRRVAMVVGGVALAYLALVVVLTLRQPQGGSPSTAAHSPPPAGSPGARNCGATRDLADARAANAQSRTTLAVAPFNVLETGWAFYEPLVSREIGTGCAGDSAGFADKLRAWQAAHAIAATGRIDAATLADMADRWLRQRPFVAAMRQGCPPAPDPSQLAVADAGEAFGGKTIMARPAALAAYRRMVGAARQDGVAAPQLQIASAWRGPDEEAARCADDSCGTAAKARCSAHRTGLAFDFVLDAARGSAGFSTDGANRLALSRSPAYRWLVAHAGRFGFVNYPYEPWHWEWTGENI